MKNNKFPTAGEKAEAFADVFSKTMRVEGLPPECRRMREKEESKHIYAEPVSNNEHYTNAPITIQEITETISSLTSKTSSVGFDAISNEMLKHLPENLVGFLHKLFQKVWSDGFMPEIWKQSIIVPILKQGKVRTDKNSYRPIALTSHVAKLLEKIVLNRLVHFCDKKNVIPSNQAGFRKGRSTTDHIVKLTTQIKQQFARRKSILATFFDVKKAYDNVWHARLLYKLKSIGLSGNLYNYIKSFLQGRSLQAKVGNTYSNFKSLQMGIPQGSVIAPMLFNILLYDLPSCLTNNVNLVQYADDICMWMKVSIRKNTPKRSMNYFQKLYQAELDHLSVYMSLNGLLLSKEKTHMLLFNNGADPGDLPSFRVDGVTIEYKRSVKFLGVFLTSKLTWNYHIEYLLNKARKSLNFLKLLSKQNWCQDTKTLIHLSTALIRSKLCYAHEAFFSAPKYLLKKLQSVDCKAYKLALGVPFHTSTMGTYKVTGVLPLDEYRKLAISKYLLRCSATENVNKNEISIRSESDYPKRAQNISSLKPIGSYTADLLRESNVSTESLAPTGSNPIPSWERNKAKFDIEYTDLNKADQPHILSCSVKMHVQQKYPNHLKVYTDGSLLNNKEAGAAFVIPSLKVDKSYSVGTSRSIFTAELVAIIMALTYLKDLPVSIFKVLFCVDSKSVLQSLQFISPNSNNILLNEACLLIHLLICRGTEVTFCWVPSHCGIFGNESADRSAKKGARNDVCASPINIPLTVQEGYSLVQRAAWDRFYNLQKNNNIHLPCQKKLFTFDYEHRVFPLRSLDVFQYRRFISTFHRLLLDAFKTKYSNTCKCICGKTVSSFHVLFECSPLRSYLPTLTGKSFTDVFSNSDFALNVTLALIRSPIGHLI